MSFETNVASMVMSAANRVSPTEMVGEPKLSGMLQGVFTPGVYGQGLHMYGDKEWMRTMVSALPDALYDNNGKSREQTNRVSSYMNTVSGVGYSPVPAEQTQLGLEYTKSNYFL